ncbi:MAG: hypothetical protein AAF829_11955, partial [Pseudomonadota bacterium]
PRHVIELVRGFSKISEDKLRMAVLSLVRALADTPEANAADALLQDAGAASNGSHAKQALP